MCGNSRNVCCRWIELGHPNAYWISGFFFPPAFLTGALQNFARKNEYAIDRVSFEHVFMDEVTKDTAAKPEDGVIVYGMFMEACRWDYEKHMLADPNPKVPAQHFGKACSLEIVEIRIAEPLRAVATPDLRT